MKKYWNLIKEINGTWLKPMPFSCSVVIIFLVQLCIANKWINNPVGKYSGFGILVALLIAAVGIDWIGNTRIFDFKKINEITPLDTFLYGIALTTFINLCCFCLHLGIVPRNVVLLFMAILLVAVHSFFKRLKQIYILQKNNKNEYSQDKDINSSNELIDLRDLNKGPVKWENGDGAIVVDERAVDYDLFDRTTTQKQLRDAISHFSAKHSYVVGLVGKWGSGKTTLLTKLKRQYKNDKDTVFVHATNDKDDFDLWLFGSQEEMIRGMYNAFLNSMGIKYNSLKSNKMLESIAKVVAGIPDAGNMLSPLLNSNDSYRDVTTLKNQLSDYIKSTDKHYIMCVENLDRASDDQVVLFLKLISTVFDFPNVTYVLLYDSLRLKHILNRAKNVNETYKEKVINQEVKIPIMVDRSVSEQCMTNLLLSYGFSEIELSEFDVIINTIAQNLSSIRELKIIINSVFSIFAVKDNIKLNYSQVLAMQYLFYKNLKLYKAIRKNKEALIVREENGFNTIDVDDRDQLRGLSSKYPAYKDLLESLFPRVKLANTPNGILRSYHRVEEEIPKKSICLSQYFNNYFMLTENDYVRIINYLNDFSQEINNSTDEEFAAIWSAYILNHAKAIRSQIIRQLNIFITREIIPLSEKRERLSEIMMESFIDKREWSADDEYYVTKCIGILIGEVSEKDFNKFKELILKKYYSELIFLRDISLYMNGDGKYGGVSNDFEQNRKKMKALYNDMQEKCYKELNIAKLINDNSEEAVDTIGRCISSNTVFDITRDAAKESKEEYGNIPKLFGKVFRKYESQLDKAFNDIEPSNDDERALYNIYRQIKMSNGNIIQRYDK